MIVVKRTDWLIIVLLGLLVALFHWRILTPNLADRQSFPPGDFQAQFWAFATFEVRELSAGRLPLWNPYTFAGSPFWADVQAAVLYPPSLLTLLLSAPAGFSLFALEVEAIAHFWLAASFMYLFVRRITRRRAAAVVAALIFTFGGYLTGYPGQQLAVLETDVWLPLILLFLHIAHKRLEESGGDPPRPPRLPQNSARPAHKRLEESGGDPPRPPGLPQNSARPAHKRLEESGGDPPRPPGLPQNSARPAHERLEESGGDPPRPPGLPQNLARPAHERVEAAPALVEGGSTPPQSPPARGGSKHRPMPGDGPVLRPLLLAGVAWGMALLAGHPQSALIVGYLSLAYWLFLRLSASQSIRAGLRTALPGLLLFLLTGLGLAAVQFLPAVEYTRLSVRAAGEYDQMAGGFPLVDLIQILLPGQVSHYSPLYVGVVGLLLAAWVPFAAPSRHTIFWAAVALLTGLIAFGGHTFLYSPLYLFGPGFSIFRGQERWAFATAFSLATLAGYGFARLLAMAKGPPSIPPSGREAGTFSPQRGELEGGISPQRGEQVAGGESLQRLTRRLLWLSLLLGLLFFFGLNNSGWTAENPFYGLLGTAAFLSLLLGLAWLLWRFGPGRSPILFTLGAAALICFDLFSVNWQTNLYPELPHWHTRTPPAVAAIKADHEGGPYRVYNEFRLYDNYGLPYAIEDLWGASPLRPARYDRFLAPPMPIERSWELLNVKYVITWREELYLPSTIIHQKPAPDGTTYVHRLAEVGPRAWTVYRAEIAGDEAILDRIADPDFARREIGLLEPGRAARQAAATLPDQPPETPPRLNRLAYGPNQLSYRINSPAPALLILSEIYYPGWRATVDGRAAPLLRADYTLRAVPIPAGEHTIELRFRPLSLIAGAIISLVTTLLVIFGLLRGCVQVFRTHSGKKEFRGDSPQIPPVLSKIFGRTLFQ